MQSAGMMRLIAFIGSVSSSFAVGSRQFRRTWARAGRSHRRPSRSQRFDAKTLANRGVSVCENSACGIRPQGDALKVAGEYLISRTLTSCVPRHPSRAWCRRPGKPSPRSCCPRGSARRASPASNPGRTPLGPRCSSPGTGGTRRGTAPQPEAAAQLNTDMDETS